MTFNVVSVIMYKEVLLLLNENALKLVRQFFVHNVNTYMEIYEY